MAELVRVAALTGYLETMHSFGINPRPLLSEQGLDAALLANPEQLIPARAAVRLLERSAEAAGCMTLGLRMAEGRLLANLGATSLLIAHQPNLRAALAALIEFRGRINSTLMLNVEERRDVVILREDFILSRPEPARQSANLVLAVLVRLCAAVLGPGWAPQLACFTHPSPPAADRAVFARMFGCPLQFDSEFTGLVVATADLDRANARADTHLASHARQLLDTAMRPAASTTAEHVDQLIRLLLPSGRASIQTCAASLGHSVRTLQRLLDTDGTSFSQLLNRARMQLAVEFLANPRMRVTDVAEILGYGSIGAFTRWHCSAFGKPPRRSGKTQGQVR
ncbi:MULTISPECIES: AraC family transcriptional regulator [unclassified Novosphingobium]|uniref:AraC family transcriptional regulator n=1 Tax=unclassified Novosphingobium TaxID=2644732 RepID=UPI000EE77F07|nr:MULTISPECIES: AraC family transcriptional regulator [unclassified Novosphingobium]HCF25271.1 AraC family transcriptional regulator [Novosphingobium sp.]HQV02539.1 AraC family transcriptional regulator [Novosphingobium sp.]